MEFDQERQKSCEYCRESIPVSARRCPYCASLLEEDLSEQPGPESVRPLSNRLKVFLAVLFAVVPGIGQLAGIITAIVLMHTEDDADRRSYGAAILASSLVMFVLSTIACFVAAAAFMRLR